MAAVQRGGELVSSAEQRLEKIVGKLTVWVKGRRPSFGRVLADVHLRVNRQRPRSVEIARVDRGLRTTAGKYGCSEVAVNRLSDAVIELIANGYAHSQDQRSAIGIDLFVLGSRQIVVCIRDRGARFDPRVISPKWPGLSVAHGRGLAIVQHCADDFGSNDDGSLLLLGFRRIAILPSELRHI